MVPFLTPGSGGCYRLTPRLCLWKGTNITPWGVGTIHHSLFYLDPRSKNRGDPSLLRRGLGTGRHDSRLWLIPRTCWSRRVVITPWGERGPQFPPTHSLDLEVVLDRHHSTRRKVHDNNLLETILSSEFEF